MTRLIYLFQLLTITISPKTEKNDFSISFLKIDNKVEVIINDTLVYSSGLIDGNPELNETYSRIYLGNYLTPKDDKVIIKLYNGKEPYDLDQKDKHWERV